VGTAGAGVECGRTPEHAGGQTRPGAARSLLLACLEPLLLRVQTLASRHDHEGLRRSKQGLYVWHRRRRRLVVLGVVGDDARGGVSTHAGSDVARGGGRRARRARAEPTCPPPRVRIIVAIRIARRPGPRDVASRLSGDREMNESVSPDWVMEAAEQDCDYSTGDLSLESTCPANLLAG